LKTVIFFPKIIDNQYPFWAPLSAMAPAAMIRQGGKDVELIDDRISEDPDATVRRAASEADLFGISIRPGNQVARGLGVAQLVKEVNPSCRVVIGGWYGSIRPQLMVTHPAVDYVIRGCGDHAALELTQALSGERPLSAVRGLFFKQNGTVIENPPRGLEDINDTPPMPYDMIPVQRYLTRDREINFVSSRGCPGTCEFCAIKCIFPEQWTGLAPSRMLDEIGELTARERIERVHFTDTDFFADLDRIAAFCEQKLSRGFKFQWWALARIADIKQVSDDYLALVKRAGCYCIETGAESGSSRVLRQYQKGIEPQDIIEFAQRLKRHELGGSMNWMLGPPGEKRRDIYATYRVAAAVQKIKPDIDYLFFRFSPIPTSTLGDQALACGMSIPQTGAELPGYRYYVDSPRMPWITRAQERRVRRAFFLYFPLAFWNPDPHDSSRKAKLLRALRLFVRLRLRLGIMAVPFEFWLYWLLVKAGLMAEGRLYNWR